MERTSGVDEQVISLPKGGGAVQGLGTTIDIDLNTGTAGFSVPFELPAGPGGVRPELALRYHSGGGDGVFGMGWGLGLLAVTRRTEGRLPEYTENDEFAIPGVENLVALSGDRYRPLVDTVHWLIERQGEGWTVTDTSDRVHRLGFDPAARIADTSDGTERVGAWLLESLTDAFGNTVAFTWEPDGPQRYLRTVRWGSYTLTFTYEDREDRLLDGRYGFLVATNRRASTVDLTVDDIPQPLVRSWRFTYDDADGQGRSHLATVTTVGHSEDGGTLEGRPLTFRYATRGTATLKRFTGAVPPNLASRRVELVDWDGDGLPDLLDLGGGLPRLWPNKGDCTWGEARTLTRMPAPYRLDRAAVAFADMNGNGTADLVVADRPLPGYYPLTPGGGFGQPVQWRRSPAAALARRDSRLVDLDGDGVADLMTSLGRTFALHLRDGDGWSAQPRVLPEHQAPPVDLRDPHVALADMTGDGLVDLVRVDGGGVTYWPALGNGRWADAVRMTPAPALPPRYDPADLYLTDVDGDGCADLVHVGPGRVTVWFTTGADRLSDPVVIEGTPALPPGGVRLADMTGTGTAGVLWTAPSTRTGLPGPYVFLDLTGGVKPHLLTGIDNGLGLTTTVKYRSSTSYAREDAAAEQPWRTFHPVAVPCVGRVERTDAATGVTSATEYHYREARFDPDARAFLGFSEVTADTIGDETAPSTRVVTTFHVGLDPADPQRPLSTDERLRLGALRRRVLSTTTYGLDGSPQADRPYHVVRHSYDAHVVTAPRGAHIVVPFERRTVEETWDRGAAPFAVREVDYLDVDTAGNVRRQRNRAYRPGQPTADQDVTTEVTFADGGVNLLAVPARVTQRDADGVLLGTTVTYYDGPDHIGLPEGLVDAGAVTRIEDLALTDEIAAAVYGPDQPDWESLGYHRLPGEPGWWVTRRSHARSASGAGTILVTRTPLGHDTRLESDPTGQYPRSATDPMGNTFTAEVDRRTGQVAAVTDPNGHTTRDEFDALGRVSATIQPGDTSALPTTSYTYDTAAAPVRLAVARRIAAGMPSTHSTYEFSDAAGRRIAAIVPGEGGTDRSYLVTEFRRYSSQGYLAETAVPFYVDAPVYVPPSDGVQRVSMRYDALGRLVRQVVPGVEVVERAYAPGGVTISRTAPGGPPRPMEIQEHDALGRTLSVGRNDGTRWVRAVYTYDHANRIASATTPDGAVTTVTYDLLGRPLLRMSADTGRVVSVVDAAGNQVRRTLPTGQTVLTTLDPLGRVTEVREERAATPEIRYSYLDSGSPLPTDGARNRIGRLYQVADRLGTITFAYDPVARPVESVRAVTALGGTPFVTTTDYDRLGRPVTVTLPETAPGAGRRLLRFAYDARGLIASCPGLVTSVERDTAARITRMVFANGTENLAAFDPVTGRMTNQRVLAGDGTVLRDETFTFDERGNLAGVTGPRSEETVTYTYDGLNRLTHAAYGSGERFGYAYSDSGNVINVDGVGELHYAPGGGATLVSAGADSYGHDAAGRLTSAPYGTLTFDGFDNLRTLVTAEGARLDYDYDFRGQKAVTYRDGALEAVSVTPHLEKQGDDFVLWLPFGDMRVAAVCGGKQVFVHPDLTGTPTLFTGADGSELRRLSFGPYGTLRQDTAPGAGTAATGAGLVCLGRRWYDPRLGRFISPDPIVPGVFGIDAWNPYVYAHDNPVAFVDPSGCGFWDVMAIVGVGLVVATLIVGAVFTGGATLCVLGVAINVSAGMMATTAIGIAGGAVVGGIAAARAGGSVGAGVLVGGLLGGIGALAGGAAGAAAGGIFNSAGTATTLSYVASGAVQGAIAGAGTGAAMGFAGGKGTAGGFFRAMWKGAAWGAATGALLGFGVKAVLVGFGSTPPDNYLMIGTLQKFDPSETAEAGLWSAKSLNYFDNAASTGFDFASEANSISSSGVSGFNGNGITEFVNTGNIQGASGKFEAVFDITGGNVGGVLLGRSGALICIPIGWVPQATLSVGGVTSAVNLSMVLDSSGKMSYADQLVFVGNAVPVLDLALGAFEEFKYGWWEDGKNGFSQWFHSAPASGEDPGAGS
ncbi:toxin TcdB middle/N-terminal domain-containing protein [Streptomyces sp. NPDC002671]